MFDFVHHKVNSIEEILISFNTIQALLGERSYKFDTELDAFQKQLLGFFQSSGSNSKESEVQKNINLLLTVRKGFDPIKLEKITTGKREIFWGFAFHCTENYQKLLLDILNVEKAKLQEAEDILESMVLNLFQAKILTNKILKQLNSIPKIEIFWNNLLQQNESISLVDKKLKTKIISEDIYLLLEKVLSRLI